METKNKTIQVSDLRAVANFRVEYDPIYSADSAELGWSVVNAVRTLQNERNILRFNTADPLLDTVRQVLGSIALVNWALINFPEKTLEDYLERGQELTNSESNMHGQ